MSKNQNTLTCSVVIPVYNAERNLPELISRLNKVLSVLFVRFEIILVNDGSQDNSWQVITSLVEKNSHIHAINLTRNFGQHNALLCGIQAVRYDILVTMDDDLQHPPEEIANLLKEYEKGFDVVYGVPQKEHHGWLRDASSILTKIILSSIMGAKTARYVSAFRMVNATICKDFSSIHSPQFNVDVLLSWVTRNISAIQVEHQSREIGRSGYSIRKLIQHALNLITGFSIAPLQLSSIMGFFFTLLGLLILVYVLIRYFIFGVVVQGFTFLASIIVIFSGAQLFAIGIIGEYLARMYYRSMDKPRYLIREERISRKG